MIFLPANKFNDYQLVIVSTYTGTSLLSDLLTEGWLPVSDPFYETATTDLLILLGRPSPDANIFPLKPQVQFVQKVTDSSPYVMTTSLQALCSEGYVPISNVIYNPSFTNYTILVARITE